MLFIVQNELNPLIFSVNLASLDAFLLSIKYRLSLKTLCYLEMTFAFVVMCQYLNYASRLKNFIDYNTIAVYIAYVKVNYPETSSHRIRLSG